MVRKVCSLWVAVHAYTGTQAFTQVSQKSWADVRSASHRSSFRLAPIIAATKNPSVLEWARQAAIDDLTREGSAALSDIAGDKADTHVEVSSRDRSAADELYPDRLLSLSPDELTALLGGSGRAKVAWSALRHGFDPTTTTVAKVHSSSAAHKSMSASANVEVSASPTSLGKATVALLAARVESIPRVSQEIASADGTRKLLLQLKDGLEVESVLIPHLPSLSSLQATNHRHNNSKESGKERLQSAEAAVGWEDISMQSTTGHTTLCISSQVGCARGCTFCRTGTMGLLRCLTADEILAQVWHGRRAAREAGLPPMTNIVFMGMGEPLNNPHAVRQALHVLNHDVYGFGLARTRVAVSTVAPSPASIRLAADLPAMLAWSVHAANDSLRKQLVPTTVHPMTDLRDAFRDALRARSKQLSSFMVEVALIDRVNDSEEDAIELANFLKPLNNEFKVCVNLIPYNDAGHQTYKRPSQERVNAFQREMRARGCFAFVRVTHGDGDFAACGQLATTARLQ